HKYTIEQINNSNNLKIKVNRDSLITGWEYFELLWILENCKYYEDDVLYMEQDVLNFGWGGYP
ncbi:MAG: hypothetical protein Q4D14_07015, partial [Bacteroidales bacterium]|nr:hypothetical protein [Bacteroidales bacterium]